VTQVEPTFLSVDEVLSLHVDQIRLFGGTEGLRDRGALESAIAMPQASFGGQFLHDDVFEMAAAYAFHIAENQPFLDGNKRTALDAAIVFLGLNGYLVLDPDEKLYDAMIDLSSGAMNKKQLGILLKSLSTIESPEQ
jgi:death on curing protein